VFNVLLQLLDDGRLTDGHGRTVDFTQTIVMMTSNLRSEAQLREFFRPEFINRLDDVITYKPLEPAVIANIVAVQLKRLKQILAEQEIGIELTPAARNEIAREGYDPEYGARPLKRVIQKRVQNLLAEAILSSKLVKGDTALIDFVQGAFTLRKASANAPLASASR
jgi:ATP-dependent Clp protease ATP-binding subunit ClpB